MKVWYLIFRGMPLHLLVCILVVISGCSPSGQSHDYENTDNTGDADIPRDPMVLDLADLYTTCTRITVHVAYEPDALPYTGSTETGIPYWSVLENNLSVLFVERTIAPDVVVPKDLANMEQIPGQGRVLWTPQQIIALASYIWDTPQTETSAEFYVLFVNGYYNDETGANRYIIGISVGGTPVIAVFKDVIADSGFTHATNCFMEQAVLVHEFGHAVGLVNNGVPMASRHEDLLHPRHCINENCVMYWENDRDNLVFFIHRIISTDSQILFDSQCLRDASSFMP